MKSILSFEEIVIEDNKLDEAGVQILTKMLLALDKLLLYETYNNKRNAQLAVDLAKLVQDAELLKEKYQENILEQERTEEQIKLLEAECNCVDCQAENDAKKIAEEKTQFPSRYES